MDGFLCLSRKLGEAIDLTLPDGRVIVVKVARISDNRVRLAFKAGKDVKILRSEVTRRDEPEAEMDDAHDLRW